MKEKEQKAIVEIIFLYLCSGIKFDTETINDKYKL